MYIATAVIQVRHRCLYDAQSDVDVSSLFGHDSPQEVALSPLPMDTNLIEDHRAYWGLLHPYTPSTNLQVVWSVLGPCVRLGVLQTACNLQAGVRVLSYVLNPSLPAWVASPVLGFHSASHSGFLTLTRVPVFELPLWCSSWPGSSTSSVSVFLAPAVEGEPAHWGKLSVEPELPGFRSVLHRASLVLSAGLLLHFPVELVIRMDWFAFCPRKGQPPLWVDSGRAQAGVGVLASPPALCCRGAKDLIFASLGSESAH